MPPKDSKIQAMFAGLVDMYRGEGVTVRKIAPLPNQSVKSFRNYGLSLVRAPSDTCKGVIAVTKHAATVRAWSKLHDVQAGVIIFLPIVGTIALGYTDVQMSIASMKAHLHKYILTEHGADAVHPDTCVVCVDAAKEIQCSTCFTSTCKGCFVKTMLVKDNIQDGIYACPGCRRETHVLDVIAGFHLMDGLWYERADEAILSAMEDLCVMDTCLTIITLDPSPHVHTLNVVCDSNFMNLRKKTEHGKKVKKALTKAGTRFMVGEPPVVCKCCDTLNHGDLTTGHAFEVQRVGVWDLDDMFGMMSVLVKWMNSSM
jgi:hypothetical protein